MMMMMMMMMKERKKADLAGKDDKEMSSCIEKEASKIEMDGNNMFNQIYTNQHIEYGKVMQSQ